MASLMSFLRESLAKATHLPADNYLSLNLCKRLFFSVGIWPASSKPKRIVALVRRSLPPFLLFRNLYCGLIGFPMIVYHTFGVDLQRCLIAASSEFVIVLMAAVYTSLISERQQIVRMFRAMEAMNVSEEKLAERPSDVVERNKRWALLPLGYLLLFLVMIAGGCFDLPGLYAKREFPFEVWYPFDEKVFPVYQIVFILTTILHNCGLVYLLSFTAMFMSLMVVAIGHFRLLSHNLGNIVGAGRILTVKSLGASRPIQYRKQPIVKLFQKVERVPAVQSLAKDIQDKEHPASNPCQNTATTGGFPIKKKTVRLVKIPLVHPKEGIKEDLKSCLLLHHAIIGFVKQVTFTYDSYLFRYLLCTLIPNSAAIVLILYAKQLDEKIKTVLMMVMGSNLGMAIICWLADHMTKESEGVRDAVYGCDWFGQSESFKKSMRIILSRCNQPVVVRVGGFVTLSMETFFKLSKLTYSYSMAVWAHYQEAAKRQPDVGPQQG